MSEDIASALKTARYNEVVVINVSSSSNNDDNDGKENVVGEGEAAFSREILLVASLNEVDGGVEWIDVSSQQQQQQSAEQEDGSSPNNHNKNNTVVVSLQDRISIVRHLRTKQWLYPMLQDHRRNELYDRAIQAASRETIRRFVTPQNVKDGGRNSNKTQDSLPTTSPTFLEVLDIGSGTGLLAMLAACHLQQEASSPATTIPKEEEKVKVHVTTVEMSSAMARLARLTVESNNLSQGIDVVEGHSCDIQLSRCAHLCTSELLESGLLGEGWIPALRDAWERHLHPRAIVVPQRARVYAQVVDDDGDDGSSSSIAKFWGPHQWMSSDTDTDSAGFPQGRVLRLCTSSNDAHVQLNSRSSGSGGSNLQLPTTDGGGTPLGFHIALHLKNLLEKGEGGSSSVSSIRVLSEPILAMEIDLSSKDSVPGPLGQTLSHQFTAIDSGTAQGVLFWWELDLWKKQNDDNDCDLTYSTKLGKEPWQDHWHQCIFVFAKPKDECIALVKGQSATLVASHNDSQIYFDLQGRGDDNNDKDHHGHEPTTSTTREPRAKRVCTTTTKMMSPASSLISPERARQLNDLNRLQTLRRGIQTALSKHGSEAVVLDLSDFSLCAIMAALLGASNVTSLESSSGDLPMTSARVAQVANSLPFNGQSLFQIAQCHAEQLSLDILGGKPATVICAEPYYEILDGWHLQEALNYYYLVRALKRRHLIVTHASCVPAFASIRGCAIQAHDLGQAYRACDPVIRGVKHAVVNELGHRFSEFDLSLPMWQYDYTRLSEEVELARIDYEGSEIIMNNSGIVQSSFHTSGTCHAMLIWIHYGMPHEDDDDGKDDKQIFLISTNDRSHRQIVRLLREPVVVKDRDITKGIALSCKSKFGGLEGGEDHQFELEIL
jgi:type III protein arginine methyltransferase